MSKQMTEAILMGELAAIAKTILPEEIVNSDKVYKIARLCGRKYYQGKQWPEIAKLFRECCQELAKNENTKQTASHST